MSIYSLDANHKNLQQDLARAAVLEEKRRHAFEMMKIDYEMRGMQMDMTREDMPMDADEAVLNEDCVGNIGGSGSGSGDGDDNCDDDGSGDGVACQGKDKDKSGNFNAQYNKNDYNKHDTDNNDENVKITVSNSSSSSSSNDIDDVSAGDYQRQLDNKNNNNNNNISNSCNDRSSCCSSCCTCSSFTSCINGKYNIFIVLKESFSPQVLGVVSECYKPAYRYFEPISLLRRFVYVALSNLMRQFTDQSLRRESLALFIWITLLIQVQLQPFLTNTENTLETSLLLNIAIVSAFSTENHEISTTYAVFILLSMIIAMCQFIYATYKLKYSSTYRDQILTNAVRANIMKHRYSVKSISLKLLSSDVDAFSDSGDNDYNSSKSKSKSNNKIHSKDINNMSDPSTSLHHSSTSSSASSSVSFNTSNTSNTPNFSSDAMTSFSISRVDGPFCPDGSSSSSSSSSSISYTRM
jgi:hypothetical protein